MYGSIVLYDNIPVLNYTCVKHQCLNTSPHVNARRTTTFLHQTATAIRCSRLPHQQNRTAQREHTVHFWCGADGRAVAAHRRHCHRQCRRRRRRTDADNFYVYDVTTRR